MYLLTGWEGRRGNIWLVLTGSVMFSRPADPNSIVQFVSLRFPSTSSRLLYHEDSRRLPLLLSP